MKIIYLISFGMAILFSLNVSAQVYPAPPKKVSPIQTMSSASDSIKMALHDAKTSFNTLFKGHKDTTTIIISNIDYEDSNLTTLKENLKKLKGVKSVSMEYKSSTVLLKIPFKGKPTDLWDQLPPPAKAPFRLIEASENYISVKFKNDKTLR